MQHEGPLAVHISVGPAGVAASGDQAAVLRGSGRSWRDRQSLLRQERFLAAQDIPKGPARTLAARRAIPVARLNMPKAVPAIRVERHRPPVLPAALCENHVQAPQDHTARTRTGRVQGPEPDPPRSTAKAPAISKVIRLFRSEGRPQERPTGHRQCSERPAPRHEHQ